jgi:predicted PolB exonuclease-like 3'-5' exonuclease
MAWTPPQQPTPFNVKPEDILFLDIETVPKVNSFLELDDFGKSVFKKKFAHEAADDGEGWLQMWTDKAALHCEFNKLACVTMGLFTPGDSGQRTLRVKSFLGYNERIILQELAPRISKAKYLCAHNGKKFDFPLLARKYVQHGLIMPSILNTTGVKPWDTVHFDTLELWQFNDIRYSISLDALAYTFGLPSPKQLMDGSKVAEVYYAPKERNDTLPWEDKHLLPVGQYCEIDVVTMANIYLSIIGQPIIPESEIVIV